MFNIFHFSEYLAADSNEKFWKFVDLSQTVSFSHDSGIYVKLDYDLKLWLLKYVSTLLGIEWFLEKCGSQKILAPSQNLRSIFIGLEILFLGNVVSWSLKYFLSLVLKFWNCGLAITHFTNLPFYTPTFMILTFRWYNSFLNV